MNEDEVRRLVEEVKQGAAGKPVEELREMASGYFKKGERQLAIGKALVELAQSGEGLEPASRRRGHKEEKK